MFLKQNKTKTATKTESLNCQKGGGQKTQSTCKCGVNMAKSQLGKNYST